MSTTIERMLPILESNDSLMTPAYIINQDVLEDNIRSLKNAFESKFPSFILAYSYKTNYASHICRTAHELGVYAEVVSPMELAHASKFEEKSKIIYNGPISDANGKHWHAYHGGIVNVDSITELKKINRQSESLGRLVDVGIRVNLSLSNGLSSRFGIEMTKENIKIIKAQTNVRIRGVHCHVTKSRDIAFWMNKTDQMCRIAKKFKADYIDLGGNMYGPMNPKLAKTFDGHIPTFDEYAEAIYFVCSKHYSRKKMPTIIIEAGTPLVSNCISYITKVTDIKKVGDKTVVTCDGKDLDISVIGDSGRPFPYYVLSHAESKVEDATLFGCTCLEFDKLAEGYTGPVAIGDKVVIDNIGSYSNVLAPRFIQGVPCMYVYKNGKFSMQKINDTYNAFFDCYL